MTSAMDIDAIIDSITCPITQDIMTDPVQGILILKKYHSN